MQDIFDFLNTSFDKFTQRSTALETVVRKPLQLINDTMDIAVSYQYDKKPVTGMYIWVTRKQGTCASVGGPEEQEKSLSVEDKYSKIKHQISYDQLKAMVEAGELECHASHLDIVLNCMYEILFDPQGPYKINKTPNFPLETLQHTYRTVEKDEVIYALEMVYKRNKPLEYPLAFYRTTLYNAALQGHAYTDSKKKAAEQKNELPKRRDLDCDELAAIARMLGENTHPEKHIPSSNST